MSALSSALNRAIGFSFSVAAVAATYSALAWFILWFAGVGNDGISHPHSRGDLVDDYTNALSLGSAHLQTPTAKLVDLPPAEQPPTDPRLRILDASYHDGRYYVYYGVLPFLAALLPWKVLTGTFLDAETFIAGVLIVGTSLLVLGYFRVTPRGTGRKSTLWVAPAVALGLCGSGALTLMAAPSIHVVVSSTAYLLNVVLFVCWLMFFASEPKSPRWLAGAVAAATLLMASRPNQAFTLLWTLGLALFWLWRATDEGTGRRRYWLFVFLLFPLAAGAGLGLFNFARFGSPLEFGMGHGTGAVSRPDIVGFSAHRVLYNLRHYLFGWFQLEPYFPFISGPYRPDQAGLPSRHEGLDQVYGLFILCPGLVLAAGAWKPWRPLVIAVLVPSAVSLLGLSGLGFGTFRYTADFAVLIACLAGLGVLEVCRHGYERRNWVRTIPALALVACSVAGSICWTSAIAVVHGQFALRRPDDFRTLAAPFNHPRYWVEPIMGGEPRSAVFQVKFPVSPGKVEPLFVTGWHGLQDFVYVHYLTSDSLRLGFESMGRGGPLSDAVLLDYSVPHRVEVVMGNAFPPSDHPVFRDRTPAEIEAFRRTLEIFIDDRSVLRAEIDPHPRRGNEFVGHSPFDPSFGTAFTGEIERVKGRKLGKYIVLRSEAAAE